MITDQQQCNPARTKLKAPFLRKNPKKAPETLTTKKPPFCRAAIAAKQSARQLATDYCSTLNPSPSLCQPQSQLHVSVDRELVRKKSELLSLNLKCIQLQEKFSILMERSNRSVGFESELQELSSADDRRSQADQRMERLAAIKARLARMDFSSCQKMVGMRGK